MSEIYIGIPIGKIKKACFVFYSGCDSGNCPYKNNCKDKDKPLSEKYKILLRKMG